MAEFTFSNGVRTVKVTAPTRLGARSKAGKMLADAARRGTENDLTKVQRDGAAAELRSGGAGARGKANAWFKSATGRSAGSAAAASSSRSQKAAA